MSALTRSKLSWTGLQALLSCGQKFRFAQVERLERLPYAGSFNRLRGSFFHAGIAAALEAKNVWGAVNKEREAEEVKLANLSDTALREAEDTIVRAVKEAKELLEFYVPLLGIGTKLTAVEVEKDFSIPFSDDFDFNGRIDAIIQTEGQVLLVDWKLRVGFSDLDDLMLDGQLYAYAWALKKLGYKIDGIRFYEFRAKLPSEASVQVKNGVATGVPNTGAASYDTTWEVWANTVRRYGAVDPEIYREKMEGKLKPVSDWLNVVDLPLTAAALADTEARLGAAREQLAFSKAQDVPTAAFSSYVCGGCDFKKLCAVRKHGLSDELVRKAYYAQRKA